MKFYGNGVVWDGENNKRLIKFVGGAVETEDERVQSILIERGYSFDPEPPVASVPTIQTEQPIMESVTVTSVSPDLGAKKLREIGKELKLTFSANMSKVDMAKAINEARK